MISIIVPIHNNEETLVKCLNSIKMQSYTYLDVIMIDVGSTDNSLEVCKKYVKSDSRFRIFHEESIGISAAKNIGLEHAKGNYVCFVQPIDFIDGKMLETLVTALRKFDTDMVTCRYYEETPEKLSIIPGPEDTTFMSKTDAIDLCLAQKRADGFLANKLYKIGLFNQEPRIRFDESVYYYEDLTVAVKAFLKSEKIVYSPPPHYHYIIKRHIKRERLTDEEKMTGLRAIENTGALIKEFTERSDGNVAIKKYYMVLNLELLFDIQEEETKNEILIEELKQNLNRYRSTELKDKTLQFCWQLTRKNIILGRWFWKMFYQNKVVN